MGRDREAIGWGREVETVAVAIRHKHRHSAGALGQTLRLPVAPFKWAICRYFLCCFLSSVPGPPLSLSLSLSTCKGIGGSVAHALGPWL